MFKALFRRLSRPRYKIIHSEKLGYLPLVYDNTLACYWVIRQDMTTGVSEDIATGYSGDWHPTEAAAGELVNRHANGRGLKTVWESR